ncbi:cilia- and flagella-associated protein HOATZ isoform X2 [Brachyhypopomus gauderio]|uniref:cilia- and flagella-associated protein HOATZ isoform X2 n=1 Tax=Brachyhypopomus gauderio TaxID=698409 RepID=UPI0040414DF7
MCSMTERRGTNTSERLRDFEEEYMVFEGSSQEDVAYAKVFWSSLCLQPPIESNLVSVDIRQRLKIAKGPAPTQESLKSSTFPKNDEFLQKASLKQSQDEKKRYMEVAQRRDAILALFRKQREERMKKETISIQHKPRRSEPTERQLWQW